MWEWAAQAVLAAAGLSAGVATAAGDFFPLSLNWAWWPILRTGHTQRSIFFSMKTVWLWAALWGIFCMWFHIGIPLGDAPSRCIRSFCRDFRGLLGHGAGGDTQCVSHIYAEGEGGQISECVYHKHGSWKRLGSFSLFLPQMVRKCAYDMKIIWGRCDSHESHLPPETVMRNLISPASRSSTKNREPSW